MMLGVKDHHILQKGLHTDVILYYTGVLPCMRLGIVSKGTLI